MKPLRIAKVAISGLALGVALGGGHAISPLEAQGQASDDTARPAAEASAMAEKALAKRDAKGAVEAAERAVSLQPRVASYRFQLARAYLLAGRFASAETSLVDTLTLEPGHARAALNLALAQIAQGKRGAAQATLADYGEKLTPSDHGLALALSGDVDRGVAVLEAGVRAGGNSAKLRQNLALAYAMQGQWQAARMMAMQDLSPDQASARILEWATFVRPATSFDQVASLLGVKPVIDSGQPTQLALNGTAAPASRVTVNVESAPAPMAADVIPDPQAGAPVVAQLPPAPVVAQAAPVAVVPAEKPYFETSAIGAKPVAAPAPPVKTSAVDATPLLRAPATPIKQVVMPASKAPAPQIAESLAPTAQGIESGRFVVQLGAFRTVGVSRDAWNRLAPRHGLSAFDPGNARATVRGASFVRLSIGGFATRAEATTICTRIQQSGGACFVRARSGDQLASWVQRGLPRANGTRVAAR